MIRKILPQFFMPVPLCVEVLLIGLILLWFAGKQRLGRIFLTVGLGFLVVFSYDSVVNPVLYGLESRYPPVVVSQELRLISSPIEPEQIKWIVVLSGGAASDPQMPLSNQISRTSLERLVEGMFLHSKFPTSRLLITGGMTFDSIPESRVMAGVAVALGVPSEDLVLETESRFTKDHPRLVRQMVREDPFILVTSASHMPRAMAMFKKHDLHPIAAPAGFIVGNTPGLRPGHFFPNSSAIRKWENVLHELMGYGWAWIRNQV